MLKPENIPITETWSSGQILPVSCAFIKQCLIKESSKVAVVKAPDILLPKQSIDYHKWAVIACDQFTSEKAYWNQVHQLVDNVPSTYHIILPEAYLDMGFETRIKSVNENMDLYLRS
ncbi:MAG: DUF1015 family protein, partial [Bacteroidales bacterium]|nr:DUF1015 family protein [Bacteroidales bacterium]